MPAGEEVHELRLSEQLRALRQRAGVVALVVAFLVGATVGVSLLVTPVYRATAKVVVQPRTDSLFDNGGNRSVTDPDRALQTQIEILGGSTVKAEVRKKIGTAPSVSVTSTGTSDVVRVTATSTIAKRAADIANAYADAYIEVRRRQAVDDALTATGLINTKISDLQQQIDGLEKQVAVAPPGQADAVRQALTPQKDSLVGQQALFKQKSDQLQVDASLQTGGAQVVSAASVPSSPASPKPVRNGVLALVAGLLLGTGAALLLDYLDDSIKTKEDLARVAPAVPVLGLIPAPSRLSAEAEVISRDQPTSSAAEAYRALRTSVQFVALEHSVHTLQVTSPSAQEGKSTTVANLGVALARAGQRVTIVCCDLRRPRIHEFFGLDNSIGFTSVLLGQVPLTAALQAVPGEPGLSVLASGPTPPNPSELLSSRRTDEVLASLKVVGEAILIDSSPILPVTDALVLSGRVDATLLVCVAGRTTHKEMARAVELLHQVDAPLVGTILNGVSGQGTYGDSYRYDRAADPASPVATSSGNGDGSRDRRKKEKGLTQPSRESGL